MRKLSYNRESKWTSADEVIAALGGKLPGEKCRCPACGGKSLSVTDSDTGKVLVKCWKGCSQEAVLNVLRALKVWGWDRPPKITKAAEPKATAEERRKVALAILKAAKGGDPASVPYLRKRGIKATPACARLLTAAKAKALEVGLPRFPALVFPFVNEKGDRLGCHVIKLTRDGDAKLECDKPKQSYGSIKGGYVELGRPEPTRPLIIGEGIETVLSAMQVTGLPGIATTGVAFLEAVVPPLASSYIIAADGDDAGRAAADKLAARLSKLRKCRVAVPEGVKDWNDALRAAKGDTAKIRRALTEGPPYKVAQPDARVEGRDPYEATRRDGVAQPVHDDGLSAEDSKEITRLAALSPLDYDRERKAVAKRLEVRDSTLDKLVYARREVIAEAVADGDPDPAPPYMRDIEPWGKKVNGEDLLWIIYDTLTRHIAMTKNAGVITTLWVMHTWCLDAATHNPFLRVWSPVKGCGKTTLLQAATPPCAPTVCRRQHDASDGVPHYRRISSDAAGR